MAGNSSTPAGTIFGASAASSNTNDNTNGNSNNNPDDNNPENSKNNDLETLISQLTSGVVIPNNDSSGNTAESGNNQTQSSGGESDSQNSDKRNPIIEQLLREYKGDLLTANIDQDKMGERLQNGDLGGIVEAIEETASNAVNRALQSVLNLIPEIITQTETRVMDQVKAVNSSDRVWESFLAEYPDYEPHKGTVRELLQKAIDAGTPQDQAFKAVDTIFGNLKKPKTSKAAPFTPESGDEPFDFAEYLGKS